MFTTSAAPASRTSHTFTEVIAWVLVMSCSPSGEKATAATPLRRSWADRRTTSCAAFWSTAKTRAVPSVLPVASLPESGLHATASRSLACPVVTSCRRPVLESCTAAPSRRANAIRRPSGLQAMSAVQHVLLPNVSTSRRDLTSKTRTPAFITELIASRRPSGLNVMLRTGSPPITQGLPPVAGKTRTLPSVHDAATNRPSGLTDTPQGWPSDVTVTSLSLRPVAMSQTRTEPSSPAVTTRLLSGLNATPVRSILSARNF